MASSGRCLHLFIENVDLVEHLLENAFSYNINVAFVNCTI